MKLSELQNRKIRPTKDLIAFKWIKPHLRIKGIEDFQLPENIAQLGPEPGYNDGLRVGRFYLGKVLAVGPRVSQVKENDILVVHEYGIKNYSGAWKDDQLYFIEERSCFLKLDKLPVGGYVNLRGRISRVAVKEILKGQEEGGSMTGIPGDKLHEKVLRK